MSIAHASAGRASMKCWGESELTHGTNNGVRPDLTREVACRRNAKSNDFSDKDRRWRRVVIDTGREENEERLEEDEDGQ